MAPFVAMRRAGVDNFICIHGARRESDLLYRHTLQEQAARYVACLSGGGAAGEGGGSECLVEFDFGTRCPVDAIPEHDQQSGEVAMHGRLMHAVER